MKTLAFPKTWAPWVVQAVALVAMLALGIVVASTITTSRGLVSASTGTEGFLATGMIDVDRVGATYELVFDEDQLYPGEAVAACVDVVYRGTIPARLRMYGQRVGGSGLDPYLHMQAWVVAGNCPADPPATNPLFSGSLTAMWAKHGSFEDGLPLGQRVENGDSLSVVMTVKLDDAQEAQGLFTDFSLMVEAQP